MISAKWVARVTATGALISRDIIKSGINTWSIKARTVLGSEVARFSSLLTLRLSLSKFADPMLAQPSNIAAFTWLIPGYS